MTNEGAVESIESKGELTLTVYDEKLTNCRIEIGLLGNKKLQTKVTTTKGQAHPSLDKQQFASKNMLVLKDPKKSFQRGTPTALYMWRYSSTSEEDVPLAGCDVSP